MTSLSPTAAADLGVSCGLPLYLAIEVADFVCDGGFAPEARVIERTSRVGSEVTLTGRTHEGRPVGRVFGAFDQILVRVPVADFGKGIL